MCIDTHLASTLVMLCVNQSRGKTCLFDRLTQAGLC
jgi:hypothetical protein